MQDPRCHRVVALVRRPSPLKQLSCRGPRVNRLDGIPGHVLDRTGGDLQMIARPLGDGLHIPGGVGDEGLVTHDLEAPDVESGQPGRVVRLVQLQVSVRRPHRLAKCEDDGLLLVQRVLLHLRGRKRLAVGLGEVRRGAVWHVGGGVALRAAVAHAEAPRRHRGQEAGVVEEEGGGGAGGGGGGGGRGQRACHGPPRAVGGAVLGGHAALEQLVSILNQSNTVPGRHRQAIPRNLNRGRLLVHRSGHVGRRPSCQRTEFLPRKHTTSGVGIAVQPVDGEHVGGGRTDLKVRQICAFRQAHHIVSSRGQRQGQRRSQVPGRHVGASHVLTRDQRRLRRGSAVL
mmetsp:Transcript_19015/g.42036  ORF Transcript_19015/g.42036 Transcript_19015/m.42036 type:complete len:342 (-) Transcript_19015:506-1531(-)